MFMVSARVTRSDVFGPNGAVERSVRCGPFLAAEDQTPTTRRPSTSASWT